MKILLPPLWDNSETGTRDHAPPNYLRKKYGQVLGGKTAPIRYAAPPRIERDSAPSKTESVDVRQSHRVAWSQARRTIRRGFASGPNRRAFRERANETNRNPWQFHPVKHVREGKPDKAQRADDSQAAIGLQDVDGLKASDHLLALAQEHIEDFITINEALRRTQGSYETGYNRDEIIEGGANEVDIVSGRIARLLGKRAFVFLQPS